jgi:hypothetical protein
MNSSDFVILGSTLPIVAPTLGMEDQSEREGEELAATYEKMM